jgi:hypothetical protein
MNLDEITIRYEKLRSENNDFQKELALTDIEDLPSRGYRYWEALAECCNEIDTVLKRFELTVDEYVFESGYRERQGRVTLKPEIQEVIDNFKKVVWEPVGTYRPQPQGFKRGFQGIEQVSHVSGAAPNDHFNNEIGEI